MWVYNSHPLIMTSQDCAICCEKFNNSTRACITCEFGDCGYQSCKSCVRQYLLGTTTDPHCMKCRKAWSQNFVVMKLNRSFVTQDYRKHRKALLLDRELSRMPDTMEAAQRLKESESEQEQAMVIRDEILKVQAQLRALREQQDFHERRATAIRTGKAAEGEKKKFIMPCPSEDCRGFLSTGYKCEICNLHTCPKCFEIIGYNKHDEHTCNEDNVKTAAMIKADTKPCPSCGTRISKIDGCDQMWCINCHQAFSWRTGQVDNGVVHNPHFYQYQRSVNNGQIPRPPGDVVCGGLPGWYQFRSRIIHRLAGGSGEARALRDQVSDLHRTVAHITHTCVPDTRHRVRTLEDNEDLRIDYILGRKTKAELESQVYRNDNLRRKYMEYLHLYELLSTVGIELFAGLCNNDDTASNFVKVVKDELLGYDNLRKYCNTQFADVSVTYNQNVPQIDENWHMNTKKFSLSAARAKVRRKKKGGGNEVIGSNAYSESSSSAAV